MEKMKTCVHCHESLFIPPADNDKDGVLALSYNFGFCRNESCSNYALLAIPEEDMPKEEDQNR